jgi:hypothetical protein
VRTVVLHEGGLGDLILVESLLAALRAQCPGEPLELLCRTDVAATVTLFEHTPDAVRPFAFNPYLWTEPSDTIAALIRDYLATLGDAPVRRFVSASLRATPLSEILAAALAPSDGAVFGDPRAAAQPSAGVLLTKLALAPLTGIRRLAERAGEHELERYARLAGTDVVRLPQLRPLRPDAGSTRALAVFPIGGVAIKRWPIDRLIAAATTIAAARHASIVVVGAEQDRGELDAIAAHEGFTTPPEVLTGTPGDLATIAARIAGAIGFIGLDTGLAHLATAYGVPGVTVYGGGHWPAYAPWRPTTAAVLAPIPCFGCNWDCAFDFAYCLAGVDVRSAVAAFERAEAGGEETPPRVEVDAYTMQEREIFARAARVYHAAESDRAARLRVITRLDAAVHGYATRLSEAVAGGP